MAHTHRINLEDESFVITFDHAHHDEILIPVSTSTDTVVTLPSYSTGFGPGIVVKKLSSTGKVTVQSESPIDGAASYELTRQWSFVKIVADGADAWSVVSRG